MISEIESQDDVASLISIFSEVWGAETLSEFVSNIQSNLCLLVKDYAGGVVTGYVFYDRDMRENFIEITDIGVAEKHRGRHFGQEMVDHICSQTDCVRLCVRSNNGSAISLYTSLGFKEILTIENYYGVGNDAIRMEWKRIR